MPGPLRHTPKRQVRSRFLPLLVLALGLLVSVAGWLMVRLELREQEQTRFERVKERVLAAITARFQTATEAMYGAQSFVAVQSVLTQAEWRTFAQSVARFFDRGVIGLGYVERIERERLPELEARLRADGVADFTVERRGSALWSGVVTHIFPPERNAGVLGLDVLSGNTRRTAAEESARKGAPVISRRINLVEGTQTVPGCLLLLPVYRAGVAPVEAEVRGWVYVSVRPDLLLRGVAEAAEDLVDFEAFESGEAVATSLLFDRDGTLRFGDEGWSAARKGPELTESIDVPVYGRTWSLRMQTTPAFAARGSRWLAWLILGGGGVVSMLAAGFTWALVNSRVRALLLADRMTAGMRQAEADAQKLALVASRTANAVVPRALARH